MSQLEIAVIHLNFSNSWHISSSSRIFQAVPVFFGYSCFWTTIKHLFFLSHGAGNFADVATTMCSCMACLAVHVKGWVPVWTGYWMVSSACIRRERKQQKIECNRKHSGFVKGLNAPGPDSMMHCVNLPSVKILLQQHTRASGTGIQ